MRDGKSIVERMRNRKKMSEGGIAESDRQGSPEYHDEFDLGPVNKKNNSESDDEHLDNEPMGDEFESDEFLADPYGEMTGNAHSSFDPQMEKTKRRGRLEKALNSVSRMHKNGGY